MTTRPIIFSAPMIRALLDGQKTQTRRIVKPQPDHDGRMEMGQIGSTSGVAYMRGARGGQCVRVPCPYGQPGDLLLCYHCSHEKDTRTAEDPSSPERRLYGGVGRADLQPDKICGIREEEPCPVVSTQGACDAEGIPDNLNEPREREGDQVSSPPDLYSLSRGAAVEASGSAAFGRRCDEQSTGQPMLGDGGRELAGQTVPRHRDDGREALGVEIHGSRARTHPVGRDERTLQSEPGGPCALCGAVNDTRYRQGENYLWVRETWAPWDDGRIVYRADCTPGLSAKPNTPSGDADQLEHDRRLGERWAKWRPSIHMPRWASRMTLRITDVRVQRLQEISEADARAEGVTDGGCVNCGNNEPCGCANPLPCARDSFISIWYNIHGPASWLDNPYVWALTFDVIHKNVDEVKA